MRRQFILLVIGFLAFASANDCPDCWERCFPMDMDKNYEILFNLINKIRGMKVAYNIKSTSFMMDGSVDGYTEWDYTKKVAALVALTIPINTAFQSVNPNHCQNEFQTSIYYSFFAYFAWSWQCKERCGAAKELLKLNFISFQTSPNWIGGGCILGSLTPGSMWGIPCQVSSPNRMALGFMNNDQQFFNSGECSSSDYAVKIAIKTGPSTSPPGFVGPTITPDPLEFDVSYTPDLDKAVSNLLECIKPRLCDSSILRQLEQEEMKEDQFVLGMDGQEPRIVGKEELSKYLESVKS